MGFVALRQQHGRRIVTHLLDRVWSRNPRKQPKQTDCRQPLIPVVPFFPLMLLAQRGVLEWEEVEANAMGARRERKVGWRRQ